MDKCDNHSARAFVRQSVTISDNYDRLINKPSINGITLSGDMTAESLNLASTNPDGYKELKMGAITDGSFLLVIGEDGQTGKIKVKDATEGRFATTDDIDQVQIGNYIFKNIGG